MKLRRKQSSLPVLSWLWIPLVWIGLGLSRLLISLLSFQRLAPLLGQPAGSAAWVPLLNPRQEARARIIGRTVSFTSRYTPWESNCFDKAIVARIMLGIYRIPYALFFGLQREHLTRKLKAHAWVAAGRVRVVGGRGFGHFAVVNAFCSTSLHAGDTH